MLRTVEGVIAAEKVLQINVVLGVVFPCSTDLFPSGVSFNDATF